MPSKKAQTIQVTVQNPHGLHMRSAGELCRILSRFQSEVFISKGRHKANGKSMLDLMSLSAAPGAILTASAEGPDSSEVLQAIDEFLKNDREAR